MKYRIHVFPALAAFILAGFLLSAAVLPVSAADSPSEPTVFQVPTQPAVPEESTDPSVLSVPDESTGPSVPSTPSVTGPTGPVLPQNNGPLTPGSGNPPVISGALTVPVPQSPTPVPQVIENITITADPRVYDGTTGNVPYHITFTGVDPMPQEGTDYTVSAHYTSADVTTGTELNIKLEITLQENSVYQFENEAQANHSLHGDITPATLTVKAADQLIRKDGEIVSDDLSLVSASGVPGDTATVTSVTLSSTADDHIIPSDAIVTVSRDGDDTLIKNYVLAYEAGNISYKIAQVTAAPTARDRSYDGTTQDLIEAGTADSKSVMVYRVKNRQLLSEETPWQEALPQAKDAGTYTVEYMAKPIADDYDCSTVQELKVSVSPKEVSVNASSYKHYDGNRSAFPKSISVESYSDQILPGDEVLVKEVEGAAFRTANVHQNEKMDTEGVHITLTGEDAGNYMFSIDSMNGIIVPRDIQVIARSSSKHYGQADPELKYATLDVVPGETLSGSLSRDPGESVSGSPYTIRQGTLTNEENPNYNIDFRESTFAIEKACTAMDVSLSRESAYPGNHVSVTVRFSNNEDDLAPSGWEEPPMPRLQAGSGEVELHSTDQPGVYTADYEIPQKAKKSLIFTASAGDLSGNYDFEVDRSETQDTAKLKVLRLSVTPQTGDGRSPILYATAALLAAGGILYMILRKRRQ